MKLPKQSRGIIREKFSRRSITSFIEPRAGLVPAQLGRMAFGGGGGVGPRIYDCSGFECECHGETACNAMFEDLYCIVEWCIGSGDDTYCYCWGPIEREERIPVGLAGIPFL